MKNTRLLSVAMLGAVAAAATAQTIQVNQNNRTIAVTVTDKAKAVADMATVHIGFDTYASTSEDAYAAGSQTSNGIIGSLHKAGVADKAIESTQQSLSRNTQYDPRESEAERAKKQFVLSQSWTVKTSAADAKNILNVAVQAGANSSGQIDWDVKDRSALQAQATAKALQHARAVADQMAQGLNGHLGPLLYASNLPPQTLNIGGPNGRLESFSKLEAPPPSPLAIRPQQIEENATVYAVFSIQ